MSDAEGQPFVRPQGIAGVVAAAWHGLLHTVAVQRNMKIHWISGFMVMLVGMTLDFDLSTRAALFFAVFLLLFAEILNSALEAFVDLHMKEYHYQAKLAKDAAAAGVLVLAAAVSVLFADIIFHFRHQVMISGDDILRTLEFGVPMVVVMIVLLFGATPLWFKWLALLLGAGLFLPIAQHSRDPFFSLSAAGFYWIAFRARSKHPEGLR